MTVVARTIATVVVTALTATSLALASPPAADAAGKGLLVGFERGVGKKAQGDVLTRVEGRVARRFGGIRGGRLALVRPRAGVALGLLRRRLAGHPGVAYAEPDGTLRTAQARVPDDPLYPSQWAVVDGPDGHDVHAPEAWATRRNCAKVGILDTGIDTDHPDLAENVYRSKDKPHNGKDDDGNGWVDDTYGVNVIAGRGSGEDDNGHGSHVAGIVAARGNNATGVSGICWSAKLVAIKFMSSRGKGKTSNAITGIRYAVRNKMKVVNASFESSSKSSGLKDAIKYARQHNVLVVVAAGNDGRNIDKKPVYPAAYGDKNILAVAASTDTDALASFSNFGKQAVDVAAPGDEILSTYLGGRYRTLSGTSMAAPYAAGLAAMLRKQEPDATYGNLRYAVRHKVDKPPAFAGKVAYGGRIDARKALRAIGSLVD